MKTGNTFVGFGFGAIQAGLFLYEASKSGRFSRLVVAEIRADLIDAVRRNQGIFSVNIAQSDGIRAESVPGVELLNPTVLEDRQRLVEAVSSATEMATALPAVDFYCQNRPTDIVEIIADGLKQKLVSGGPRAIIYTAENCNHAAEILTDLLDRRLDAGWRDVTGCLNTVIGKMSGVVQLQSDANAATLTPLAPDFSLAFLVESFNNIMIEQPPWKDFDRGITVFEPKADLLPFEEAKLYGHNAIHSLIGFLLLNAGCRYMSEAAERPEIMALARQAFIEESGRALCSKYEGLDRLFTEEGFADFAEDLLERMLNPFLSDSVARVTRDPRRKLGWDDRLVGTARLCLKQGVRPVSMAKGMAAAITALADEEGMPPLDVLPQLWMDCGDESEREAIRNLAREWLVSRTSSQSR